jgi:hypothetical protein
MGEVAQPVAGTKSTIPKPTNTHFLASIKKCLICLPPFRVFFTTSQKLSKARMWPFLKQSETKRNPIGFG